MTPDKLNEAVERLEADARHFETRSPMYSPVVLRQPLMIGKDLRLILSALRIQGERETVLRDESAALTKALTGLTRGGSEYFIRNGDRYVADIPACVSYVQGVREMLHRVAADARREVNAARSALTSTGESHD